MRFFAAVLVAAYHLESAFGYALPNVNPAPTITFFFVLSGFVLTYRYPAFSGRRDVLRYYAARISRIWPLHLATALYFLLFIYWLPQPGVVIANLLMLQSWSMKLTTAMSMNGVAWSISVEFFFYMLLPLVIVTRRHIALWLLAAAALVVFGIVMSVVTGEVTEPMESMNWRTFLHVGPPARLVEFLAGVGLALLFQRWRRPALSRWGWTLVELAAVAGIALTLPLQPGVTWAATYLPGAAVEWLYYSGSLPIMCLVVLCFAYRGGAISQLLSWAPLVFLGEMSFSIYMVHQLVQVTWLFHGWKAAWDPLALATITVEIFVASALAFLIIEGPARKALMVLADRLIDGLNPDGKAKRLEPAPSAAAPEARNSVGT